MGEAFDAWGNLRGSPVLTVEEAQGDNFINIFIYKWCDLFIFGYQLKVGTILRQHKANIGDMAYKTEGAAREAAAMAIEAICATNKNSKKYFAEFQKIRYTEYDLFGGQS